MTTTARLSRVLRVMSLSVMLCAAPTWAQQSHQDTADDTALTSQEVEDEADDGGGSFEQDIADIERQYADLVPDHHKNAASTEALNDAEDDEDEIDEDE